jgi:signal transduction histidine kinase
MRAVTGVLANPTLQRWLPVIVLPPVLLLDGLLSEDAGGVDLLSALFAYLAVLPLALRERLGFFGMAPLLVGGVVLVLWDFLPGTTVVAIPAWALFDLARERGRRETIIAAVAVGPCVLVSVLPFADSGAELVSVTLRNLALCELALAAGYLMWHNRAALEREVSAREADAKARLGDERLRIAREVHDVVAHAMVAINVQAGVAAHLIDEDTEQARQALQHIKRTKRRGADRPARDARHPPRPRPRGARRTHRRARGLGRRGRAASRDRVDVVVDVDTVAPVPTPVHSASYRIVQEALTNVLRHADARRVSVVARADDEVLKIVVADDGTARSAATSGAGAGLRGMRERTEALGGTLTAGPGEERGWRVEATLPLTPAQAQAQARS